MMRRLKYPGIAGLFLALSAILVIAQWPGGRNRYYQADYVHDGLTPLNMRNGVNMWDTGEALPMDQFTFARVRYDGGGRWGGWTTDMPDAEMNFSWRLSQMTSLIVNPTPGHIDLTNPGLYDYPFIYMVEPGNLYFSMEEATTLRNYLDNGGFLMVDDFWMDWEWQNFEEQMTKVFPDQKYTELPQSHPIFNMVFPIREKPQVPNVRDGVNSQWTGVTWENKGPGDRNAHYRGWFDDEGRLVVLACHNTDLGDGWEREGENHYYFKEFSEAKAYPMGINILVYAMTH